MERLKPAFVRTGATILKGWDLAVPKNSSWGEAVTRAAVDGTAIASLVKMPERLLNGTTEEFYVVYGIFMTAATVCVVAHMFFKFEQEIKPKP
ncbi:hypothetical protein HYW66_00230 [Candidatus Microgenomates bacterium]|nr:hypothetical protein [Candidatus Microgenomates bacterium]